ncbi:MAG: anaerobic ribonucleoside-triphosphate reductase activating protein [Spirochaetota bacterium]|jgi:pyruvate formate lyase activating enzyme|nr:anaerobic ribonucleoside-triphosphate reductase activating protein [Spirochaetota bacterium]
MLLAGYVPSSLIDFPGRVSAVAFSQGCTLRCPWCHNAPLVHTGEAAAHTQTQDTGEHEERLRNFFAFLERRRGLLAGVVISGGEPCIHADLAEFLGRIRSMGFLTKLDTNGTRPQMLASLLEAKLVDLAAMDIKGPRDRYAELCGVAESALPWDAIRESIRILAGRQEPHLFRTTCMEPQFDTEAVMRMRELVPKGIPWHLQPYKEGSAALDPAFTARAPAPQILEDWQRRIDERG